MIAGLASLVITLSIVIFVIRRIAVGRRRDVDLADEIKDFFQYLLLLILIVIVNSGLSGLIDYVLGTDKRLISNPDVLARDSAFVVVATPLLVAVALWTRRTLARERGARESFALLLYLSLIQIISFIAFATSSYRWLINLIDDGTVLGSNLGGAFVWLITLAIHYRFTQRTLNSQRRQLPFLILSGISLVISLVAFARVIRALMVEFLPFAETIFSAAGPNELTRGLILALIALPTWYFYWASDQSDGEPTQLWNIYLLIVGVGASLVAALVSISTIFYDTLVWFFGDASTNAAWVHFDSLPSSTGALLGTTLSFAYHSRFLASHHQVDEGEIGRIYRYLLTAIGLVTTAIGSVMLIVSIVESLVEDSLLVGRSPRNALLLAVTLLIVGLSLWQSTWREIQRRVVTDRRAEISAISRKVYLFTIVGVSAIAAVVSVLTITVQVFQGLFGGDLGDLTLREISFAISILIVGLAVGISHLRIIRAERGESTRGAKTHEFLLLIGPADRSLAKELERSTGARVEFLESLDGSDTSWDRSRIETLLAQNPDTSIALVADSRGINAIPIKH